MKKRSVALAAIGRTWNSVHGVKKVENQAVDPRDGREKVFISADGSPFRMILPADELEGEIRRDTVNYERVAKRTEDDASKASMKAEHDRCFGFTDGMTPLGKARVIKALDHPIRHNGVLGSRRNLIKHLVDEGRHVRRHPSFKRIIESSDGAFLTESDLSKLGMDFAEYLIKERS